MLSVTTIQARRLAITKQHLAGALPKPSPANIFAIIRDLGCVQIDPINVVARSPQLVVFSRIGDSTQQLDGTRNTSKSSKPYRVDALQKDFESLIFREKKLFEYWAHCASIVLTEDYPIHNLMMRDYLKEDSAWGERARQWIASNARLRRTILGRIKREGPLQSRAFQEDGVGSKHWISSGWTSERNVARMLHFLWLSGKLMVSGRDGLNKTWDLSARVLPDWTPRDKWREHDVVRTAAQRSLRALGVATPRQVAYHYIRGRYPDLKNVLRDLEAEGKIQRVQIAIEHRAARDDWYIHADDIATLDNLTNGAWEPRTTVLSPFDNLIADRARTEMLFDFNYRVEIYVPKEKRKYGYYVLPILHGDQLIGRVDSAMDRPNARLVVNQVYAEKSAPKSRTLGRAVEDAIESLAAFLGAREIVYKKKTPEEWR